MVNEPCCYPLNLREVWQSFRLNIFFFIMWVNFYCYQILSNYIIKQKLQYQAKYKIVFQTMRKKLSVAITHLIAITTETLLQHFQFCFVKLKYCHISTWPYVCYECLTTQQYFSFIVHRDIVDICGIDDHYWLLKKQDEK
jgi:hypothetical protein